MDLIVRQLRPRLEEALDQFRVVVVRFRKGHRVATPRVYLMAKAILGVLLAVALTGCIDKTTTINAGKPSESDAPGEDDETPGALTSKPSDGIPAPSDDPGGGDGPTEPMLPFNDSGAPVDCNSKALTLERDAPIPFEIYCDSGTGGPFTTVFLFFENSSGMTLTNLRPTPEWYVSFVSDDAVVERIHHMPVGGGPWDLRQFENTGDEWAIPDRETKNPPEVCARCGEEIQIVGTFASDEIPCIRASSEYGTLDCR